MEQKSNNSFWEREDVDRLIYELGVDRELLLLWRDRIDDPAWGGREIALDVLFRLLSQLSEHIATLRDRWQAIQ